MKIFERISAAVLGKVDGSYIREPTILTRRNGIYLKEVPPKGRGVFCKEDIKAGDVIEVAPVLIFDPADSPHLKRTLLYHYIFSAKGFLTPSTAGAERSMTDTAEATCLPMGVASLCNHLVHPNAVLIRAADDDNPTYLLTAKEDIPAGTEICISYGIAWLTLHRKA